MNRIVIASVIATLSGTAVLAEGPVILSPQDSEGILHRNIDRSAFLSVRPLPRPDWIEEKYDVPERGITLSSEDFPLSSIELSYLSGEQFGLDVKKSSALRISFEDEYVPQGEFYLKGKRFEIVEAPIMVAEVRKPTDPMMDRIHSILETSYGDMNVDGDNGYDRLISLAENNGEAREAAVISSDEYVVEEPVAQVHAVETAQNNFVQAPQMSSTAGTIMGQDPAVVMLSSMSDDLIARLSPEQMNALVMAAQGKPIQYQPQVQQAQQVPVSQPFAQAPLSGIPSLDYRGEDLPTPQIISASDVPSGSMPFSEESLTQAMQTAQIANNMPAPVSVGDGQNLLLKGWKLGLTGTGAIGMYMDGDPGSIIEISEGMVVGPLGSVERLTMENGNIVARFSSGEVMTSPAALVSLASL